MYGVPSWCAAANERDVAAIASHSNVRLFVRGPDERLCTGIERSLLLIMHIAHTIQNEMLILLKLANRCPMKIHRNVFNCRRSSNYERLRQSATDSQHSKISVCLC